MRIAFGTSERGSSARKTIIGLLQRLGHQVVDIAAGNHQDLDYTDIAAMVAGKVSRGEVDRGILAGGTGIGMCIVANKFPGVRAAPCHDDWTAEISRRHNDLNVLCLAAAMIGEHPIRRVIEIWLSTPFDAGRHARRIAKIKTLER